MFLSARILTLRLNFVAVAVGPHRPRPWRASAVFVTNPFCVFWISYLHFHLLSSFILISFHFISFHLSLYVISSYLQITYRHCISISSMFYKLTIKFRPSPSQSSPTSALAGLGRPRHFFILHFYSSPHQLFIFHLILQFTEALVSYFPIHC